MDWGAWTHELGRLVVPAVFVLGFTVALWSDRTRARKMARKWGVPEPTDNQVDEVLRYRRLRLACYPLLYPTIGACCALLLPLEQDQNGKSNEGVPLVAMFLFGAVVAELLILARSRQREPMRLRLPDMVPRWGLGVFGALVLATFVLGLIDLRAQPYITPNVLRLAEQSQHHAGAPIAVPFVGTAVVLLLVAFLLWSAQRRSFSGDVELDRALRTRDARVALGLGVAMQLLLVGLSWWRMEFLDFFGTGADPFGPRPADVAIKDWAKHIRSLIQPWTFVIAVVALPTWISVANPGRSRKTPQRTTA